MKLCAIFLAFTVAWAQTPPPKSVVGEVTGVDAGTKQLKVKGDDGGSYIVGFDENTSYLRMPLGEKDLKWQGHYLDILKSDQFAPEYQKLNPKAVVPTLVHDGQVIVESTVINEYIDETFADVPLKPVSPAVARVGCGDAPVGICVDSC